jgi:hypothetical protein
MTATTPQEAAPLLRDLTGVWRRTLLIDGAGNRDDRSEVVWLQAGSYFVDLRRPAEQPPFGGIACVADMSGGQREWAMDHQGFAGTLVVTDGTFEWRRSIDLQPPGPVPDAGRLRLDSGLLVETGLYADYTEHWLPQAAETLPAWAMRLRDEEDRPALLIRVGDHFGWARGRLPHATPRTDFFDCEIALGRITGASWRIAASSLPFREGDCLAPKLADGVLVTADRSCDGHVTARSWQVESDEGGARL